IVLLEQMPKLAHRRLIRGGLSTKVDAYERAHRTGVVQSLFHRGVREVEPVLQEMNSQHPLKPNDRSARAIVLWIERLDQGAQFTPWHYPVHVGEELLATSELAVRLEAGFREGPLAHVRNSRSSVALMICSTCDGINQSFL